MHYFCYVYFSEDWRPYFVGKGQGYKFGDKGSREVQNIVMPPRNRIQCFYFDEEWEAYECETDLILFFGRQRDGGCLVNINKGGPSEQPRSSYTKKSESVHSGQPTQ